MKGMLAVLLFVLSMMPAGEAHADVYASQAEAYAACMADTKILFDSRVGRWPYYATDYRCEIQPEFTGTRRYKGLVYEIPWQGGTYGWSAGGVFDWPEPGIDYAKEAGEQKCSSPKTVFGNPISAASGNKFQKEVDIEAPGLSFVRYYNSTRDGDVGFGQRWTHSFSARIEVVPGSSSDLVLRMHRPDGQTLEFYKRTSGDWTPDLDQIGRIEPQQGGGWAYYGGKAGEVEKFDDVGRLQRLEHLGGSFQQVIYGDQGYPKRITSVHARDGRSLGFSYAPTGHIQSVTLSTGEGGHV